jgi:poly-gamma-glutamate synthesis protein (capsule biosynthesis protein)
VPGSWAASAGSAGIHRLPGLSADIARRVAEQVGDYRRQGDIVVASIHWGDNWGYDIPAEQTDFAHRLIDDAGVDIIHGHSSHHPRAIEVYRDKPVFYGCGDFINDYEGIGGHETFRGDLGLMYFVDISNDGALSALRMVPMQMRRFRLNWAEDADTDWLAAVLDREGRGFNTAVSRKDRSLALSWTRNG